MPTHKIFAVTVESYANMLHIDCFLGIWHYTEVIKHEIIEFWSSPFSLALLCYPSNSTAMFPYTCWKENHMILPAEHLPHFPATSWRRAKRKAILEGNQAHLTVDILAGMDSLPGAFSEKYVTWKGSWGEGSGRMVPKRRFWAGWDESFCAKGRLEQGDRG